MTTQLNPELLSRLGGYLPAYGEVPTVGPSASDIKTLEVTGKIRYGWFSQTTPDGVFTAVLAASLGIAWSQAEVSVVASGWTDQLERLVADAALGVAVKDLGLVSGSAAQAAVLAYYDGQFDALDAVPTRIVAGPFLSQARAAMRRIPAGQTRTYGQLAVIAGRPGSARAAGTACSGNPTALFVPCHRVLAANGKVGAFGYGSSVKRALLQREGAVVTG